MEENTLRASVTMDRKEYTTLYYLTMEGHPMARTVLLFAVFAALDFGAIILSARAAFLQENTQLLLNVICLAVLLGFTGFNLSQVFRGKKKVSKMVDELFAAGEMQAARVSYELSDWGLVVSQTKRCPFKSIAGVRTNGGDVVVYLANQKDAYLLPKGCFGVPTGQVLAVFKKNLNKKQIFYML